MSQRFSFGDAFTLINKEKETKEPVILGIGTEAEDIYNVGIEACQYTDATKTKSIVTKTEDSFGIKEKIIGSGSYGVVSIHSINEETQKKVVEKDPNTSILEVGSYAVKNTRVIDAFHPDIKDEDIRKIIYDQFVREVAITKNLSTGGIGVCKLYVDPKTGEGMTAMSIGQTLSSFKPKNYNQKFNMICSIVDALYYLHKNGIAHCDVKLDNIIYTSEGEKYDVRFIDFGLAYSEHLTHNYTGRRIQTSMYRSLDMKVQEDRVPQKHYIFDSDVWACGIVAAMIWFGTEDIKKIIERKNILDEINLKLEKQTNTYKDQMIQFFNMILNDDIGKRNLKSARKILYKDVELPKIQKDIDPEKENVYFLKDKETQTELRKCIKTVWSVHSKMKNIIMDNIQYLSGIAFLIEIATDMTIQYILKNSIPIHDIYEAFVSAYILGATLRNPEIFDLDTYIEKICKRSPAENPTKKKLAQRCLEILKFLEYDIARPTVGSYLIKRLENNIKQTSLDPFYFKTLEMKCFLDSALMKTDIDSSNKISISKYGELIYGTRSEKVTETAFKDNDSFIKTRKEVDTMIIASTFI